MVEAYINEQDPSAGLAVGAVVLFMLFYAALLAFGVYCYVRIARKAGYSGWYAALLFVPIANLVVMLMFVFKEWPIEAELRMLRSGQVGYGGYGRHPGFDAPAPYPYPGQQSPYGQPPQG